MQQHLKPGEPAKLVALFALVDDLQDALYSEDMANGESQP